MGVELGHRFLNFLDSQFFLSKWHKSYSCTMTPYHGPNGLLSISKYEAYKFDLYGNQTAFDVLDSRIPAFPSIQIGQDPSGPPGILNERFFCFTKQTQTSFSDTQALSEQNILTSVIFCFGKTNIAVTNLFPATRFTINVRGLLLMSEETDKKLRTSNQASKIAIKQLL